jgi:hypothetical protein
MDSPILSPIQNNNVEYLSLNISESSIIKEHWITMYSPIVSSIQINSLISFSIEEKQDHTFEKCLVCFDKLTNEYTLHSKHSFHLNFLYK